VRSFHFKITRNSYKKGITSEKMLRKKRALSAQLVQRQKGEYKRLFENDSLEIMLVERQKGEYKYELLKAPDFCS